MAAQYLTPEQDEKIRQWEESTKDLAAQIKDQEEKIRIVQEKANADKKAAKEETTAETDA